MDNISQGPACMPRLSNHRAPPMELPSDSVQAAALVLNFIQTGETAYDRSGAIEAATARVQRLSDPNADISTVVTELAGHAAILDALFLRWSAEAMAAKLPEIRMKYQKLALSSQASYTRTLIAIEALKQQCKGKALVTLNNDDDRDHDDDSA